MKRDFHFVLVFFRRCALKDGFEQLLNMLPNMHSGGVKPTNAVVLARAAERIRELKSNIRRDSEKIKQLKQHVLRLDAKIKCVIHHKSFGITEAFIFREKSDIWLLFMHCWSSSRNAFFLMSHKYIAITG